MYWLQLFLELPTERISIFEQAWSQILVPGEYFFFYYECLKTGFDL